MPSDIRSFFGGRSTPSHSQEAPKSASTTNGNKTEKNETKNLPERTSPRASKTNRKLKEESEDEIPPIKPTSKPTRGKKKVVEDSGDDDDDFEPPSKTPTKSTRAKKSTVVESEEEDDQTPRKPTRKTNQVKRKATEEDENEVTPKKTPPKKKTKREKDQEVETRANGETQAILDSIPLVRPPTPPTEDKDTKKFNFGGAHANSGPAPAAGSKEIPTGEIDCLAGLSFVFTGLLESISRDQGTELVKRYGGKVMTAPSSKTNFVVLGSDAGPKKLETIQKNGLKTIDENGLFELIRRLPAGGGDSNAAAKAEEKRRSEIDKAEQSALEAEAEEKAAAAEKAKRKATAESAKSNGKHDEKVKKGTHESKNGQNSEANGESVDTRLWTVKYAPSSVAQICGNKGQVEKLQRWLRMFPKNQRKGFKLAGADGSGVFRAVIISGPPGIGKTTAAHLVAKLEGFDVVETNASDHRSKKLVETGVKGILDTTSLLGYFSADGAKVEANRKKLVMIMDEVDGMSAGDRGGVGALAQVCKKTQIPLILICNDRKLPKMKPFDYVTFDLPFRRPTTEQIRSRIMTIGFREKMKLPPQVLDALIEGTGADIRQIINMVSTAKLDQEVSEQAMDYDQSKKMSKAWEKHIVLKPWDLVSKILSGGMFAATSKATLNEKSELYFNDHEFSHLMLQENFLKTQPILANNYKDKQYDLKKLELVSKAADSISEGDLIDRMIHGSEQHWSLMPTHAIFSFVRPASFVSGSLAGSGGIQFTSWLGKNSSQGKLTRQVKEIQGHMRLRASGDRFEIRQQYLPLLWLRLVKKLETDGKDAVPEVVERLDEYFLTREDWDSIMELGVGPMDQAEVKLDTQTKATFTRIYNAKSHPLPFMKASQVVQPKKATKEKPDLEEALEESDEGETVEVEDDTKDDDDEVDLSKDKYIKMPKKRKASSAAAGKAKSAKTNDDGGEDSEDIKPKKGKGKGKAKK